MKLLKALLIILFLTVPALGREELYNLFNGVKTLKIVFSQRTKLPVAGDEVSLYEGVIYYKRPLKFRWEYTKGANVLIVSDGKFFKSEIEGECQIGELSNQPLFPLIELIEDPQKFKRDFEVKEVEREGSIEVITVKPKYEEAFFKELKFVLERGRLKEVETLQEDGTRAKYRIEKVIRNLPLKDSLFKITPCK